jgi:potassium-dependent mechanosensitive channel
LIVRRNGSKLERVNVRTDRHIDRALPVGLLMRRCGRRWRFLPIAALMIVWAAAMPVRVLAQTSAGTALSKALKQPAAPTPVPEPPAKADAAGSAIPAIPLPEVADQAEELDRKLAEASSYLRASREILAQNPEVAASADITERALHVDAFLAGSPDILQLRDEIVYWRTLNQQSTDLRKVLAIRAAELQRWIGMLNEEQARWQATQDQIGDDTGIEAVGSRVHQELEEIRGIHSQAQEQLNRTLTLQNQLSLSGRRISDALEKLSEAEEEYRGHIFQRDSEPLWDLQALRTSEQPMETLLRRSVDRDYTSTGEFLRSAALGLLWVPFIFVAALFGAFRLRRYLQGATLAGVHGNAAEILSKPYLLAFLAALMVCIPKAGETPSSIALALYLIWIGLIVRLTPFLIPIDLQRFVRIMLALNAMEFLRVGIPLPAAVDRILLTLILLASLAALGWLARPSALRRLHLPRWPLLFLTWGAYLGMLLLALALLANVCGFSSLSRVLGVGALLGALYAAGLYCSARVLLLLLAVFLHGPWARPFSMGTRQSVDLWGRRGIVAGTFVFWLTHSQLYVLLFRDSVAAAISNFLDFSFVLGKVEFTIGSILSVGLILGIGFLLAKVVSSLLRSVLIARLPIQRGLPYAISKFVYYALVLLVLFAAVTRAGVELNKFTVITGALGVGVGFGLQNIVNNFASGLILLFERPIRVGDTVEVNGLIGTVGRIGARSSTVTTAQGAEVIVPNSNLIANQVVNWTLSSPWRRVEIPVGVAYGSDPEAIIKLLVAVVANHADVMTTPPPTAYFLGFGDSALNFELRFWADRQDIWFQLKSDVSVAVANALKKADIEIPFPQRDLHLRSMDVSIGERPQFAVESKSRKDESGAPVSGAGDTPVNPTAL